MVAVAYTRVSGIYSERLEMGAFVSYLKLNFRRFYFFRFFVSSVVFGALVAENGVIYSIHA